MKILSISTSSNVCSCSILENTKLIKELSISDNNTHSIKLMPQISQLLSQTNLTLNSIDLFACDIGPGSFTGIRIGISTIKAFCDITNKPCIGIPSLTSLIYNLDINGFICSLIDAKNNNAYYSLFDYTNGTYQLLEPFCLDTIENITNLLKKYNKLITFVGNGSIEYKDVLEFNLGKNYRFYNNININSLTSTSVGIAAFNLIKNSSHSKIHSLSPLYLRKSNAERLLEEKLNANKN